MKVFLDANILVSVLNKEYPLFTHTSRILSLSDNRKFHLYTSPVCLAIAFYFAEKKYGSVAAKGKIHLLSKHINSTTINNRIVSHALEDKRVLDFEDGLEYYSAKDSNCQCIVTQDVHDFHFSEIEVLTAEGFFETFL
jgi:predicted nucleic acid-binding protein